MNKIKNIFLGSVDILVIGVILILGFYLKNFFLAPCLLFFVPGYLLTLVVIPGSQSLKFLPRLLLSIGISVTITGLATLLHGYFLSNHIDVIPFLILTNLFISILAFIRRIPRYMEYIPTVIKIPPQGWWKNIKIFYLLILLGSVIFFSFTALQKNMGFSEFYLVGPTGKASKYPSEVKTNSPLDITVGIVNHEGHDMTYIILAMIDEELIGLTDYFLVPDNEGWEEQMKINLPEEGDNQKVKILLGCNGCDFPYHDLTLWLDSSDE